MLVRAVINHDDFGDGESTVIRLTGRTGPYPRPLHCAVVYSPHKCLRQSVILPGNSRFVAFAFIRPEACTRTRSASIAWAGRYLELFLVHPPAGIPEQAVARLTLR